MDREIAEESGEAMLTSVRNELEDASSDETQESDAKKRRSWNRKRDRNRDEVPAFVPLLVDLWAWSAMELTPFPLPEDMKGGPHAERGHKRGRGRHDSASLHSSESMRSDGTDKKIASSVIRWIRSSSMGRG